MRRRRRTGRTILAITAALLLLVGLITALSPRGLHPDRFTRCVSPLTLRGDLTSSADKRELAQMLVGSAEHSNLYWEAQAAFLQYNVEGNEEFNRGYTGGIIGFTSKTASMLEVVRRYAALQRQDNPLAPFLPALEAANGTPSKEGLGPAFEEAWREAADDPAFLLAQLTVAEDWYLEPALDQAGKDGVGAFGQYAYYDAMIHHGSTAFTGIREAAGRAATVPSAGGDETAWLQAFLDAREAYMLLEVSPKTATRVTTAQQGLLDAGELGLDPPLDYVMYGDHYRVELSPLCHWW